MQKNLDQIMEFFFTVQIMNKLYHFNTTSFARHKATDNFDGQIQKHIDKFGEVYMGRYNIKPVVDKLILNQNYLTDTGFVKLLNETQIFLQGLEDKFKDSDLLTIRDELLADVNNMLYLFRLN